MNRLVCKGMGRSVWGETGLVSKNQRQQENSIDPNGFRISCILA